MYTGHPLDEVSDPEADTIVVMTPTVSKSNAATTTSTSKKAAPRAGATRKNSSATSAASKTRGVRKESVTKAPRKQGAKSQASTKGASKSAQSPAETSNAGNDGESSALSPSDIQPPKRKSASSDEKSTSRKRVKLNDDGSDSELSDLGQTPEPPTFIQPTPDVPLDSDPSVSSGFVPPATPTSLLPPTPVTAPAKGSKIVRLKVPTGQPSPSSSALATALYTPPSTSAPPKRAPRRNSKKSDVIIENEDDYEELGESSESPTAAKAAKKRRVVTPRPAPRNKPAASKTPASRRKTSSGQAEIEAAVPTSMAEQSLPSPPSSQSSQSDFLENIDPELLKLSRSLAHREPLESKPLPIGKPEVWAPGRQELCETLPYYKSAHSGCYANNGNIYAFMFDSVGTSREYMDQDVIIARMGGSMATDAKTGAMYQKADHDINDMQPQSVLNNMAQMNPLVIICGSQNQGSVTRMPHRYCVLDWFKPTHVWGEMTKGKKGPVKTIRYRFERLNRSKASWYCASNIIPSADNIPADLALEVKKCTTCGNSCPQVYLLGWMCTNPECSDMWKLSNGQLAPYGDLDYHPAFLLHKTTWEREGAPFSLNPGVPQIGQHFGDNLSYVNTRGVVCPDCGRCNTRYLFTGWRCDTQGCGWKLMPEHQVVMPTNLHHTPWDITSAGPSLIKATAKPAVKTHVKYFHNYKVVKYTIQGVDGSVIVAKANSKIVSEAGGPDDMFREMQSVDVGLERRMLRKSADVEADQQRKDPILKPIHEDGDLDEDADVEADDHHKAEVGARMTAFGMNFGMPYKFIASGDSKSFEEAPAAIRAARSRLNWAQSVFVNDQAGYQDFNEELVFAYLEDQKIKYHDDGEKGLGSRIATLSLGAAATMSLRVKTKYFSQVSNTGVFTYEEPLPLPLLESSGYASGYKTRTKSAALQASAKPSHDTYADRLAAYTELQSLRASGDSEAFRRRSKEIPKQLDLRRRQADALLSFHLTHGDIVIMEGEQIQKFLEHQVEPHGNLRFALTCRTVLPNHLPEDQLPPYEVGPDGEKYDGRAIREEGDGEAVVWS